MELNEHIYLRVPSALKTKFKKACSQYGAPAAVHRQLIEAFVDGRVTIRPDPTKPRLETP